MIKSMNTTAGAVSAPASPLTRSTATGLSEIVSRLRSTVCELTLHSELRGLTWNYFTITLLLVHEAHVLAFSARAPTDSSMVAPGAIPRWNLIHVLPLVTLFALFGNCAQISTFWACPDQHVRRVAAGKAEIAHFPRSSAPLASPLTPLLLTRDGQVPD